MRKNSILKDLKPRYVDFFISVDVLESEMYDFIKEKHGVELPDLAIGFDDETDTMYVALDPKENLSEEIIDKIPYSTEEWYETATQLIHDIFQLDHNEIIYAEKNNYYDDDSSCLITMSYDTFVKWDSTQNDELIIVP